MIQCSSCKVLRVDKTADHQQGRFRTNTINDGVTSANETIQNVTNVLNTSAQCVHDSSSRLLSLPHSNIRHIYRKVLS